MEARVLDTSGGFHKLDPASIEIVAPTQGEDHTYSDWRQMRAPLPAVRVGSIMETVTIRKSSKAMSEGGDSAFLYLGAYSPTLQTPSSSTMIKNSRRGGARGRSSSFRHLGRSRR